MVESSGFDEIIKFQELWDEYLLKEDIKNRILALLDGQDLILFFKKDQDIFGANEENRLIFAKLKEKKENEFWKNEASFMAINLSKAIEGENVKSVFNKKNLKEIKVIDHDEALKLLLKKANKKNIESDTEIPIDKICLSKNPFDIGINNIDLKDKD